MLAALVALTLTMVVVALAQSRDIAPTVLLRDPAAEFGLPFYTGALSYLSQALLLATGAIAAFTLVILKGRSLPLAVVALMSGLMYCDDLFMLHEKVAPYYLGIPPVVFPLFYGICVVSIAPALLRDREDRARNLGFLVPFAFLGAAVGADILHDIWGLGGYAFEDGFKMAGFAAWLAFWTGFSAQRISET